MVPQNQAVPERVPSWAQPRSGEIAEVLKKDVGGPAVSFVRKIFPNCLASVRERDRMKPE
jgi:hypothetical protein